MLNLRPYFLNSFVVLWRGHNQTNVYAAVSSSSFMPLAFLAPDIVAAILAGRQPADLTNQKLIRQVEISLDWQDQRRVLGLC